MSTTGVLNDPEDAYDGTQKMCNDVKAAAESKTGKNYSVFRAEVFALQQDANTYFIKVLVGEQDHVHLRVHFKLPSEGEGYSLDGIQERKTHWDPIKYF